MRHAQRSARRWGTFALTPVAALIASAALAAPAHADHVDGWIQICKDAATGSSFQDDTFNFTVGTAEINDVKVGECSHSIPVAAGTHTVTEEQRNDAAVTDVRSTPSGMVSWTSGRSATVTVVHNEITTVHFTNRQVRPGWIQVCKEAESGSTFADNTFNFTVGNLAINDVPVGSCSLSSDLQAGTHTVTEEQRSDAEVVSVTGVPAGSVTWTSGRSAQAVVQENEITTVTFTNRNVIRYGTIKVCKVAGTGVASGTPFSFTVDGGTPFTVNAGSCTNPMQVTTGTHTVVEQAAQGYELESITIKPAERGSGNVATRTATLQVVEGLTTEVEFKNRVPQPTYGTVKVCKVAGTGVASGTPFSFTLDGGAPFTVNAGSCTNPMQVTTGTHTVVEQAKQGYELESITIKPAERGSGNVATRTATLTVVEGLTTEAEFKNRAVQPPQPTKLQVCKANLPGADGQQFTFAIEGQGNVTIAEGTCTQEYTVQPDTYTVDEDVPSGFRVASITGSPSGSVTNVNLTAGSADATVASGQTVVVTFTNERIPSSGCTLTQGYWKNHPEAVREALRNGEVTLDGSDALSADEIRSILRDSGREDYSIKLAHQLIAAQLNLLAHDIDIEDAPQQVEDAIEAAQHFFATDNDGPDKPSEIVMHPETGQMYTLSQLNDILDRFNRGQFANWPHCDTVQ